jgi:protein-L-isoaspartate(D-aspartate) O-methyltransferase
MPLDFEQARSFMVEQQVRPWDVLDPRVLATLSTVKREDFVPARHRKLAFADLALPLEHDEFMMKPVLEGRVLQSLELSATDEVLEIGTGSGFLTACLANLVREMVSIDIHADFVERAKSRLAAAGFTNAKVLAADAASFDPGRRFDAIAVTGAVDAVPESFLRWMKPNGRLFAVRGHSPRMEAVLFRTESAGKVSEEILFETDLPYLQGFAPVPEFAL